LPIWTFSICRGLPTCRNTAALMISSLPGTGPLSGSMGLEHERISRLVNHHLHPLMDRRQGVQADFTGP
jgi:hypothetical protein